MNTVQTSLHAGFEKITSPEQELDLKRLAAADRHAVVAPSHLIVKQGEIIGYVSIGTVAMLNAWIHTRRGSARDSIPLLRAAELDLQKRGFQHVCLPVAENSPFLPLLERLGYERLGWSSFNLKRVN